MADPQRRERVVVIGAGFGGLSVVKGLARSPVDITLIDQRNHHLFQPLLYQVATAALSPADIAWPIRSIFKCQKNVRVMLETVTGVDTAAKAVIGRSRARIPYDTLVVATGARHSYFGNDQWAAPAPGLKTIEDAIELRRRVLIAFERAETETDEALRRAYLTFVVVGAGPTGVEMAGAIAELARHSIAEDFRTITPHCARILLVEAGERVLATFPPTLSERARRSLEAMGVEVLTKTKVEDVTAGAIRLGETWVPCRTAVWAAGVKASPAGEWLGAITDRLGRVQVNSDFSVPGHDNVFVIGDTAVYMAKNAKRPLPGIAPAAKQAGGWVAQLIRHRIEGRTKPKPFEYRDYGNLATIGRASAVVDFGRVTLSGPIAWLVWSIAHVYFLIGIKTRLAVAMSWAWSYVTYQRGARLITGDMSEKTDMKEAA